jgi:hypothetical protein
LEVDEETGEVTRKNPEYDGAYLDMHMGPMELTLDPKKFFNFHFKLKGTFMLLGFIVVIDIDVSAGSAEDGGGMRFYFKFEWLMPGSNKQLALIAGNFDLIPLDFAALVTFDLQALADTKLMLGLIIRPTLMNKMIDIIEPSVKLVIKIAMTPITYMIQAALMVLNALIKLLEMALKAYRRVVGVVLAKLQAFFAMAMTRINAAQRGVDKIVNAANAIRRTIAYEKPICEERCTLHFRMCCSWRKCHW